VQRASLPIARSEMNWAAAWAGRMHVIGGYGEGRVDRNYHQVYDPATDRWFVGAPLPRGANHVAVAAFGGRVYALGGFIEQNRHSDGNAYAYDVATDRWTTIAPLSRPRGAAGAVALAGHIHVIGGATEPSSERASIGWHEAYDPQADRWQGRKPLPGARDHLGIAVYDEAIHVIGGRFNTFEYNTGLHHRYIAARDTEVLVVGAGPTGLVMALWLTRLGVRVRLIDKTAEPGTTSRAVVVQARILEHYNQLGLADALVADGLPMTAVNLWVAGRRAARASFGDLGAGLSPFPYALIYPQDEHERFLIGHLHAAGVEVERRTELVEFHETGGGVRATVRGPDGTEQICECAYVAGCDGAHSRVREVLDASFPGGTYAHVFYVADVQATGPVMNRELNVALDAADLLAVFPLAASGHVRLIGTVRQSASEAHREPRWDDVSKTILERMRIDVVRINWFSTYHVHHRVTSHFRKGRAFLLGDAAHIHSPVGGQGMNTGIGDAINLAWKLAAVLRDAAAAALLDSYEPERIRFARRLVATTDRVFTFVTRDGAIARFMRLHVAPRVIPAAFALRASRRYLFRTVSQIVIKYAGSTLSEGTAGAVTGGDRLPWIRFDGGRGSDGDNFAPLATLDWQLHVYGEPAPDVAQLCNERQLPLHAFAWHPRMRRAGVARNALYLVRPDGYVALADRHARAATLRSYLDTRRLRPFAVPRASAE
jgi:2-polyprenyl-6-methoxyphenol hydroxylase-like FAD-dependent oxidoreductase